MFFKSQLKSFNPDDTYLKYTDATAIKYTILTKSPYQAFHLLSNLRKSANMDGSAVSNLSYLSDKILKYASEPPHISV